MSKPDVRIDRVIRATIWNHQTVSILVQDGRFYAVRTGVLAAAGTGSVLSEASTLVASHLVGGSGKNPIGDLVTGHATEGITLWTGKKVEGVLTTLAGKAAKKQEDRIGVEPIETLAKGWMSANLALSDITSAQVSETTTDRVKGRVPQLKIKTGKETITLRFPHAPMQAVQGLAEYLLERAGAGRPTP